MGNVPRSSVGSSFLELDGVNCGPLQSATGGEISAEVVVETVGPDPFPKKHIGQPRYEEFELRVGVGMGQSLYDWIATAWGAKHERRSGAIIEADANLNAKVEHRFVDALLTETTIPPMDAAVKGSAYLTVKFAPESIAFKKASGKVTAPRSKQKQFIASNFRLELAGLDCSKVSKVDAFTVKVTSTADPVGTRRRAAREPSGVEFPNLRVTLAESSAQTWRDWFDDFVVKGNSGDQQEKSGALVFLDPARKTELGRVNFANVGIFALRRTAGAGDQLPRVVADLYCEKMELKIASPGG